MAPAEEPSLRVAQHPVFQRRDQDLVSSLTVPMTLAALGADVEVTTLEGPEVVRLEAGTASGKVIRVEPVTRLTGPMMETSAVK